MWNERPDRLTPEWKEQFTNLVNGGGKVAAMRFIKNDPRHQEPV